MVNSDNLYTILMTLCKHRIGRGGQDDKDGDGDQCVPGDMLSEKIIWAKKSKFCYKTKLA